MTSNSNHSVSPLVEGLGIAALSVAIAAAIIEVIPYIQQPEIVYSTEGLTAPMAYEGDKPFSADVQLKMLAGSQVKILYLVVRNNGKKSASDVLVRIPMSPDDGYLGGWLNKSEAPFTDYMLGAVKLYRVRELAPAGEVRIYLYLKNVSSTLADRIEVFDGKGTRAARYSYVPARQVGDDQVVISMKRRGLYFLIGALLMIVLLSAARIMRLAWRGDSGSGTGG